MKTRLVVGIVFSLGLFTIVLLSGPKRILLLHREGSEFSDFPFSINHQGQQLAALTPKEEPKAADNPIGLAEAAKILKDSEMFDKSKGSDAMDSWKAAVKDSGPAIIQDVTDDATSYNPFPKSSLSEKMEIEDVWNKAKALAKPAGSLEGDAATAKKAVENAESQADASAYLAANEAAATDAYDVSIPNVDMMARNNPTTKEGLAGRALARSPHSHPLTAPEHQALSTARSSPAVRVQALAELTAAADGDMEVAQAARADAKRDQRLERALRGQLEAARGREEEAARMAASLGQSLRFAHAGAGAALGALAEARATAVEDEAAHARRMSQLRRRLDQARAARAEARHLASLTSFLAPPPHAAAAAPRPRVFKSHPARLPGRSHATPPAQDPAARAATAHRTPATAHGAPAAHAAPAPAHAPATHLAAEAHHRRRRAAAVARGGDVRDWLRVLAKAVPAAVSAVAAQASGVAAAVPVATIARTRRFDHVAPPRAVASLELGDAVAPVPADAAPIPAELS